MVNSLTLLERWLVFWRTWRSRGAARMDLGLWLHWVVFGRYPLP